MWGWPSNNSENHEELTVASIELAASTNEQKNKIIKQMRKMQSALSNKDGVYPVMVGGNTNIFFHNQPNKEISETILNATRNRILEDPNTKIFCCYPALVPEDLKGHTQFSSLEGEIAYTYALNADQTTFYIFVYPVSSSHLIGDYVKGRKLNFVSLKSE